jgi:hypothetical protein
VCGLWVVWNVAEKLGQMAGSASCVVASFACRRLPLLLLPTLTVQWGNQFFGAPPTCAIGNFSSGGVLYGAFSLARFVERCKIASAVAERRNARELRAKKYDLRRIIAPQQQHHQ